MSPHERLAEPPRLWRSVCTQLAVPLALIVVIGLAILHVPKPVDLDPLLIVAPAIAASYAGPRPTAAVAVIAVGAQVILRVARGGLGGSQSVVQVLALLILSVFVVGYATVRERRRRKFEQVRSVSEAAQRVVLRPLPHQAGALRIASMYLATTAEARIGGDLYAAARVGGGTRLIIGDVRGKGLATIGDATLLLCAFRETAHELAALPRLVTHLEASVGRNLAELAETDEEAPEYFITAAILDIPDERPLIKLIDCGHPPPLLLSGPDVTVLQPARPGPPLGLGELAESGYRTETFPFGVGDLLVLYTDGVIDARSAAGEFYPLAERIRSWPGEDPDALVRCVRDDLLTHVGGRLDDDAALIVVRREDG